MSLAWHIAMLTRCAPKKFPKHDKLMQKPRGAAKAQTQDQQMNLARLINAMYGGKVVGKTET